MKPKIRLLASVALLGILLVACEGDSPSGHPSPHSSPTQQSPGAPSPTSFTGVVVDVTVAGGKVQVDKKTVEVKVGRDVRIRVNSDVEDEIHVHGYDLNAAVVPGQPSQLDFVASIPGTFEVELEKSKLDLFRLQVS